MSPTELADPLAFASPPLRAWFTRHFDAPTTAQALGWPSIVRGDSTLLLAPTGSGKTLAAFLVAIQQLMFSGERPAQPLRILYVSPLKALGVDVERNLQTPLAGIAAAAERDGVPHRVPVVGVRSGDTPAGERQRLVRRPPDILITTPESLYLMLTSAARRTLASVDTVIIDEIHSLVSTKRGAHLFLSLERLEALRRSAGETRPPLQRIGLSATQRPLDEVARALGGYADGSPRPVTLVDAGRTRPLELTVEVHTEDLAGLSQPASTSEPASIWPDVHARLIELIGAHRSTLIFANSRRLAERLVGALNELAGAELALAHHGSVARDRRLMIEERLKQGTLPAIVATGTLELGIDMGAIDLVVQIEAPPSVAAGVQRIGRAGHQVGASSRGVILPKFRGDLLACAAVTQKMRAGEVEATYYPRNPLDVLAQQIVAMTAIEPLPIDTLYARVCGAAPFAELPRSAFEGVLDMLSGRYPSDQFSGLRPRISWDRVAGQIEARAGAKRVAVISGGTIPDRGLYGVFITGDVGGASKRVGELDEEMVLESFVGDVFILGASSWRITEITHDRVLVVPAPGEPGRMPFWHGDRQGRPLELGRAIGALVRDLVGQPADAVLRRLRTEHDLDALAARNLRAYIEDQRTATIEVPSDRTIVVERFLDEVGDWRIALLCPLGMPVLAPWAMVVRARLRARTKGQVDVVWSDDGFALRLPESDEPPPTALLLPEPDAFERQLVRELDQTSLFAARFRENAARALLLPRRMPGKRTPLWVQRRRATDLLDVASDYGEFPIVLETYRECLQDVFDLPGVLEVLSDVQGRRIQVHTVDSAVASPFASALMFGYVAQFLYDGDAPLAERRAQALSLDTAQLRELLGDAELRELLDSEVIARVERQLQRLDGARPPRHADDLHDLLLSLGDLSRDELARRAPGAPLEDWLTELRRWHRAVEVVIAGEPRWAPAEDAARLHEGLGTTLPDGLPASLLAPPRTPLLDLVSRYARTHGPFVVESLAARLGIGVAPARDALGRLAAADRVVEGAFLPGGRGREWVDTKVLRRIKRESLARLRRQVEPVEGHRLAAFAGRWQGLTRRRRGLDGLLEVVDSLQGAPLVASELETRVLPARVEGYRPGDLDALCASGELVWRGLEPLGPGDGRLALYRADQLALLAPDVQPTESGRAAPVRELLAARGAIFFGELKRLLGGFEPDLLAGLWDLVWAGEVTNDTLLPLRSWLAAGQSNAGRRRNARPPSRRMGPAGCEGRWSRLPSHDDGPSPTERLTAIAGQLLRRHGVLTREAAAAEGHRFGRLYRVLRAMEEAGKIRRGYFVAGLGASQFAWPGAEDRLREAPDEDAEAFVLAATDPANPYGAGLRWPTSDTSDARPQRAAGARVAIDADGRLLGWLSATGGRLWTFLPDHEPERAAAARALAGRVATVARRRRSLMLDTIDGEPAGQSALLPALEAAGFVTSHKGLFVRRGRS